MKRLHAPLLALATCALASCPDDTVAGGTGVDVHVVFDAKLSLDQLGFSFILAGAPAFTSVREPVPAAPLDPDNTVVEILLPSSLAGQTITIAVDGFHGDSLEGSGQVDVKLVKGKKVPAEVKLGAPLSCGDGKVRLGVEGCDDGGLDDGDGCSADCAVEPGFACNGEPSSCVPVTCGDGTIDDGEQCDDSNVFDDDGCSHACTPEPGYVCSGEPSQCTHTCGDGVIDDGEACDDNNVDVDDGCDANCAVEPGYRCSGAPSSCTLTCGNGVIDDGEACDDENLDDDDGCSSSCNVDPGFVCIGEPSSCHATCGDGTLDPGEACDDGGIGVADGCDANCAVEPGFACTGAPSTCAHTCGNGDADAGEACDDGNTADGDGCSSTCTVETGFSCPASGTCSTVCGDGLVRGDEECDDGNTDDGAPGDGCSSTCTVETGFACAGEPSSCGPACHIGGIVVAAGAADPTNTCRACDPTQNPDDYSPVVNGFVCDDGVFCNGADSCDAGACTAHAGTPCSGTTPSCNETDRRCDCASDSCNDGAFCNGVEACDAGSGACGPGTPPTCGAPTPVCNEVNDQCAECAVDSDCTNPANPSCLAGVCVCQGCGCPTGQHDGGDGTCVADGTCSPGFARGFVDGDGDGVGAGSLTANCFPGPPFPAGISQTGTDCDDGNANVFQNRTLFPDNDADGFTGASGTFCVGSTLPANLLAAAAPPPFIGYDCASAITIDQPGPRRWNSVDNAERIDTNEAESNLNSGEELTEPLVVTGYSLGVPGTATITGVEVRVTRRFTGDGTTGNAVTDLSVTLTLDGNEPGTSTEHASATPWPENTRTVAVYGGRNDTWGLTLTPAVVNAPDFGVVLVGQMHGSVTARVDGIQIRVFTNDAARADCDDGSQAVFSTATNLRTDADGDGFTVGADQTVCAGATIASTLVQTHPSQDDCFDSNAFARPNQTGFFTSSRGDGSFDYNCDGSIQRSPSSVTEDETCQCDVIPGGVCSAATTASHSTSGVACGSSTSDDFCSGECDTPTCALSQGSRTVRCH